MSGNIACFICCTLLLFATGCGSNTNTKPTPPEKAVLTFPEQNELCTSGSVISTTQSTITFTWGASAFTDSYEIDIKNLLTGVIITQTTAINQLAVTLSRDTPYSWYVVSKSKTASVTAQSDTWKFYSSGLGTVTHLPFPADSLNPTFGQYVTATDGVINLTWKGSDVDNDILGYDVYFGTTNTPAILKSNLTDMFLNGVAVTSGTIYYWKIITKDSQGDTSDSDLFQFTVN